MLNFFMVTLGSIFLVSIGTTIVVSCCIFKSWRTSQPPFSGVPVGVRLHNLLALGNTSSTLEIFILYPLPKVRVKLNSIIIVGPLDLVGPNRSPSVADSIYIATGLHLPNGSKIFLSELVSGHLTGLRFLHHRVHRVQINTVRVLIGNIIEQHSSIYT